MEFPDNEEALKAMKYKDVQKVAKKVGVKGTLPKVKLIERIMEVQLDVEPCKISKIICSGKLQSLDHRGEGKHLLSLFQLETLRATSSPLELLFGPSIRAHGGLEW